MLPSGTLSDSAAAHSLNNETLKLNSPSAKASLPNSASNVTNLSTAAPGHAPHAAHAIDSAIIEVNHLSKRVTTTDGVLTIVNNAHFSVAPGEAIAIVGASGSGKSTLLGLMAGLDDPTEGFVAIQGQSLSSLDEDGRAKLRGRLVGFVFQSFQLLPSLTALENVMLPLELSGVANAAERAKAILERVGLGARVKHYPKQLSGGEQQRVAIARAFVTEPKLLFADEPTGNLDAKTGRTMIELLFELNRERGTTLVLVTHDLNLASRCGRRLTIDEGVISAEDEQASMAM
jgi:putative ABC transport system ATP-binding protein